jgi:hypothetical protein
MISALKSARSIRFVFVGGCSPTRMRWDLKPRAVTVDGVGDEYAGAHDTKERGDCFQHDDYPKGPAHGPNGMRRYSVKGISFNTEFCKRVDVLMQHIGAGGLLTRSRQREPSLTLPLFERNV